MRWRNGVLGSAAMAALLVGGSFVFADPALNGTYHLQSRGYWSTKNYLVKLWVKSQPDGTIRVVRQEFIRRNGVDEPGPYLTGTGTKNSQGALAVTFESTSGITGHPIFSPGSPVDANATYTISSNGQVRGSYRGPNPFGTMNSRVENGRRVADEPIPGEDNGGGGGTGNSIADLKAQVTRLSPVGTIAIKDVPGAIFERALGAQAASVEEPCALLKGEKLKLQVAIASEKSPAAPITARLTGSANGKVLFDKSVNLSGTSLSAEVESSEAISAKVAITELNVAWKLDEVAIGETKLRVYTAHKAPIHNIAWDSTETATKRHFENACRWANGASQNVGQGADSIAHQIDNQMRHLVHWEDLGNKVPAVPDYEKGAAKPVNYDDLDGSVSSGVRSISSLYYPPLEPTSDYQQYRHYRNNFGWFLLDNPTHVGGRCNQQASLVCAIVGTVGLKGQVHYLERTGRGKTSGRPVRQYFYAQGGGGPWNFHGVALIDLDDGSQWIYDGSFSWPPNRKNGTKEWAENAGGPFVGSWADWYYEDFGGKVPASDVPTSWDGVQ